MEQSTATSYIQTWQYNALTSSNVKYFYEETSTSGLMYNLYADIMLGRGLVPSNVYTVLTEYYGNLISGEYLRKGVSNKEKT